MFKNISIVNLTVRDWGDYLSMAATCDIQLWLTLQSSSSMTSNPCDKGLVPTVLIPVKIEYTVSFFCPLWKSSYLSAQQVHSGSFPTTQKKPEPTATATACVGCVLSVCLCALTQLNGQVCNIKHKGQCCFSIFQAAFVANLRASLKGPKTWNLSVFLSWATG